jgi:hypothetical protein
MKKLLWIFMLILPLGSFAQDISFRVEVSTDSILFGNYLEVRFTIENAAGDFNAPAFDGFEVLSGPNTSSSFSMINGNVTQQASYSYLIRPLHEGMIYVNPASFSMDEKVLETEPIGVMVHPNPAGIEDNRPFRQDGFNLDSFSPGKYKKEGKTDKKKRSFEKNRRKI